jgi:hypothetical protein
VGGGVFLGVREWVSVDGFAGWGGLVSKAAAKGCGAQTPRCTTLWRPTRRWCLPPGAAPCFGAAGASSARGAAERRAFDLTASTSVCTALERALGGRLVGSALYPPASATCAGAGAGASSPPAPLLVPTLLALPRLAPVLPLPSPLPLLPPLPPPPCICSCGALPRNSREPAPPASTAAVGLFGLLQSPPARCDMWSDASAGTRLYERRRRKLRPGVPSPGTVGTGEPQLGGAASPSLDASSGSRGMDPGPEGFDESLRVICSGCGSGAPPAPLSAPQLCGVLPLLPQPPLPALPGGRGRRLVAGAAPKRGAVRSAAKRLVVGW